MGVNTIYEIKVKLTLETNASHFGVSIGSLINIDIEEYLKAVVASEIANSHIEACKAQAVAARTFAMTRMRNRGYVYDSTIDQVFIHTRGDSVSDYPNAIKGVEDTAGQILTYNGKLLRDCPFGASNTGQTKAYENLPYLISKPDPWDVAETAKRRANKEIIKVGNKVGLSQYGARWAANNNIGYREVLDFYYPNTVVAENYGREVMAIRTLNEKEKAIVTWAKAQVGSGYAWGSVGQTLTDSSLAKLISQHGTNVNMPLVLKWMGHKVFDCAGLITAAFSNILNTRIVSGVSSQWKGNYWELKGTIDTMPRDVVCVLYKEKPTANPMQHGGLYLGDDTVVDARGTDSGVLFSKFESYPWSHWAIPKGLLSAADIAAIKGGVPIPTQNPGQETGGEGTMEKIIATAKTNGASLALRKGMSTAGEPITRVVLGTVVNVLEKTNATWWKVQAGKDVGYVMKQYLTELNVAPVNPAAPDNGDAGQDEVEDNQFAIHLLCKSQVEADAVLKLLKTAVIG